MRIRSRVLICVLGWTLLWAATGLAAPTDGGAPSPQGESSKSRSEEEPQDPNGFRVDWKDGLRAETNDGRFLFRIGGRLQTDLSFPLQTQPLGGLLGKLDSDSEVRRGRLYVSGHLYENLEYKFQVDFAGGKVTAKDMYMGIRGWGVGVRFGHVKEPFSLEEQASSRFITFMERSLANAFAPSRNTGLVVWNSFHGDRSSWAIGAFRDSNGFEATPGDNFNFTARLTHAMVYSADSRRLVHLGVALQHREIEGVVKVSARPGDHTVGKVLDVKIPADSANALGLEAAANLGSLSLQGEYISQWVSALDGSDPRMYAWYVQANYYLTGETRPYSHGHFERVEPRRNFPGGPGGWEIAARYALLDVRESGAGAPGRLWNLTLGVNWYWNAHARVMFNYELADLTQIDTNRFASLHTRFMVDF